MIIHKRKLEPKMPLKSNSKNLKLEDSSQYLWVNFQNNGLLKQAAKLLADKFRRAHLSLLSKLQD